METLHTIPTSEKVLRELKEIERTKMWLCRKLGITPKTLNLRLKNNDWKAGEILALKQILNID